MNDDWRLQVDPDDSGHAKSLTDRLEARELRHDLSETFHDRVIVTRDDNRVFLYAGTREQAESARELLLGLAKEHGWDLEFELKRWHSEAEDWEDPDKPLPDSDTAKEAEHEALMAAERRQTEERGYPEFEVRVDLPSHHDAVDLAERLRGEGLLPVHRWRYVLIGATDEDNAKALAERIEGEAPTDSKVGVEGTWKAAYDERPPNPFAFMGGLGG
jgi:hypothetical protein